MTRRRKPQLKPPKPGPAEGFYVGLCWGIPIGAFMWATLVPILVDIARRCQ